MASGTSTRPLSQTSKHSAQQQCREAAAHKTDTACRGFSQRALMQPTTKSLPVCLTNTVTVPPRCDKPNGADGFFIVSSGSPRLQLIVRPRPSWKMLSASPLSR